MPEYLEIVDEDGHPVSTNEAGTITVRKDFPALFGLYYKDHEKTQSAYRGNYFLTGDRASKDEDNYFWFEGRNDDVINSFRIYHWPF